MLKPLIIYRKIKMFDKTLNEEKLFIQIKMVKIFLGE
jgi:hypothetical protein